VPPETYSSGINHVIRIEPLLDSSLVNPAVAKHADRLVSAGVAGTSTSHGAENNLHKIRLLIELDSGITFGMDELLRGVSFEEAYEAAARHLGYQPDTEETPGRGCIDLAYTAASLLQAGERIRATAGDGGRIAFGTGHPGALVVYYLGLARWVQDLGGEVLVTEVRGRDERDVPLDWAGPVAVMGDGASLLHTHDPDLMSHILRQAGSVDLVVADHGFSGAAIAAGIPAVTVMDTNDPAVAVVARRGADVTVVPMDDNRPLNSYATALEVLKAVP
jgi:Phosphatase